MCGRPHRAAVTHVESVHRELGATFRDVDGVRVPETYGRPERAHLAVRNGVGLTEPAYVVLAVDRDRGRDDLAAVLSVSPPGADGEAVSGRLVDDTVHGEATVLAAEDRLLCLVSPGARDWLPDRVDARDRTDALAVFGVHGPRATEKVAGVLHGAGAPETRLSFTRGRMNEVGVTVLRTDDPAGDEGYGVICAAAAADDVHDTLLVRGSNATPFGARTWETLTLEAGTPLPADLDGCPASVLAGDPRVVGLRPDRRPATGDAVCTRDGRRVGRVLRAVDSPSLDRPIALAAVDPRAPDELHVGDDVDATRSPLPFHDGSAASGRVLPESSGGVP